MNVGIYGGSFNPPHNGHLMLTQELGRKLALDKIIIIPSNISPQKDNNGNIDPVHRLNMCKIAFSDGIFEVSDCEIKRGGRSYTIDTLTFLESVYKDASFYLFMGSDMLLSFDTWYRFSDILNMCTVCAISRSGGESSDKMREYVKNTLHDENVRIFDVQPFEVSSSEIREKIANGGSCEGLIPTGVSEYIKENKLYGKL